MDYVRKKLSESENFIPNENLKPYYKELIGLINRNLKFLDPFLIILHGSQITGNKYSNKKYSDLDLIIVSFKISFWPKIYFYNELQNLIKSLEIKDLIDITFASCKEIIIHLQGLTSLGLSLKQGFTILGSKNYGNY